MSTVRLESTPAPSRRARSDPRWSVLATLLAGLTLTAVVALHEKGEAEANAQREFSAVGREIADRIRYGLDVYAQALRSGAAFYARSDGLTRGDWRAFVRGLKIDQAHPGSQALGIARLVNPEQLTQLVQEMKAGGEGDFRVWPEGERGTRAVVVFSESFTGSNGRVRGFDMFSDPVRRTAMERARDEDAAILSGQVILVQDALAGPQTGTVLFVPVYRRGAVGTTPAERRAALVGWAYSPFRAENLIQGMLGQWAAAVLQRRRLEVCDGETPGEGAKLYDRPAEISSRAERSLQLPLDLAGRRWILRLTQYAEPGLVASIGRPGFALGAGVVTSLLLAGLVYSLTNTRAQARRMARKLTEDLNRSEERWKFAIEGSGDGLWDWDGEADQVFYSRRWKEMLGYAEGEAGPSFMEWQNSIHPEDRERVQAAMQTQSDRTAPLYSVEYRIRRKTGDWIWVLARGIVVGRNAAGQPRRMIGTHTDITPRKQAEAALHESNFLLRKAQEVARLGSFRFDIRQDRWTSSPMLDAIFGIDSGYRRDLAGWINLVAPGEQAALAAYVRDHVLAGRQRFDREYEVWPHSDRRRRWVHGAGELELDQAGQPVALIGTIQDISARRAAEQALRESERRLQEAQELARLGSWRMERGPEGERWQATPELRRIYGRKGDEPLPRNFWFEVVHPEDREIVEAMWERFLRGEGPGEGEHRIVVQGQTKWVSVRARVHRDPATGRLMAVDGTSLDITARKTTEAAHARLVTAVAQAAETIVITDTAGHIVYANPAFERTTGYTCAEVLGRNPRILKSARHDPAFYAQMWTTLARGEVWSGHIVNRRKDGALYEEDATIAPVRDAAGRIVNYVAVKRDVTREVQLENQFRQAQKMEAVGQLAGGVAHDFNNILAAVLMILGLLEQEKGLDAFTRSALSQLGREIQRGAALTRQLLAFSRQQAMEAVDVELHEVVAGLLKMLRRLLGEDITIEFAAAGAATGIRADPGMIEQVVVNLCINARDAMPAGGRLVLSTESVELSAAEAAAGPAGTRAGPFVCLKVADSGAGMSAETQARIFEPFFTTKEKGKGTGLGLAMVYGIVQQHRGWVCVESRLGAGTTFRVYLPRLVRVVAAAAGPARPAAPPGQGETILLVEDEAALRTTMAMGLRQHGYEVLEAPDGPAALDHWQRSAGRIGLVLTDMVMPGGMSGHDLIARLLAERTNLPILASTGYSSLDPAKLSTPGNRITVLRKPYGLAELLGAVRARLDQA